VYAFLEDLRENALVAVSWLSVPLLVYGNESSSNTKLLDTNKLLRFKVLSIAGCISNLRSDLAGW